mmetsp:Transcript_6067/g.8661  ORF Transcript_6067/g.8661 Transcript_6067/m.8661 type:complete len:171 (-) Transcript_6067:344-856(-)|eukprot:CAMPEP_0206602420 /NCGR_PEP_ID=MMETSP0325_2-20121206/47396_1 /ASSEMBLY_ACC=CAM_ASM_000347 /TAXON_ID=2866 /ORGANISM="Crypthecodinium cohnii, Strain Seligo" /LENGTH=170 /DNA_ID=CAMNT_0054114943 /DNA_START=149 /DNA_END=661 /DNA_ORIENTATION=+
MASNTVKEPRKHEWQTSLFASPLHRPSTFALACCCPGFIAYQQRSILLDLADEEYLCFAGHFDDCQCCCGRFYQDSLATTPFANRELGLCCEAFCCTPFAVTSNRSLLQKNFKRRRDVWSDCVCCCLMGVQLTQHAGELDAIQDQLGTLPKTPLEEHMVRSTVDLILPWK